MVVAVADEEGRLSGARGADHEDFESGEGVVYCHIELFAKEKRKTALKGEIENCGKARQQWSQNRGSDVDTRKARIANQRKYSHDHFKDKFGNLGISFSFGEKPG